MSIANRAARQRRIVRDGQEAVRLLLRLREDLSEEIPDVFRPIEGGAARAADLVGDIGKAFDAAIFYAQGQSRQAQMRLDEAGEALHFTRERRKASPPTVEQVKGLLELFGDGEESTLKEIAAL